MRRQDSAPCVEKIRSELEKRLEKMRRDKILTKKFSRVAGRQPIRKDQMNCQTCGCPSQEKFCPSCGEKRFDPGDLKLKHLFRDALESIFDFDNKVLASLKTLLFRPGALSVEFVQGKRVRFIRPIQLFLIANLLLFIAPGNPFALHLENYLAFKPFTTYNTNEIVSKKLAAMHLTLSEYAAQFNAKIQSQSKEFIFLYIPFYAVLFFMLFFLKRRMLSEHLIFSTHFVSFCMVLSTLTILLIDLPFSHLLHIGESHFLDNLEGFIMVFSIFVFLTIAIKRFYRSSRVWSVLTAAFVAVSFFTFMQYYRMLLFYKITLF